MNNKFNLFSIAFFASSQIFAPSLTGFDALRDPAAVASVNIRNLNLRNECLSRRNLLMPSLQPGSTPAPEHLPLRERQRRNLISILKEIAERSHNIDMELLIKASSKWIITNVDVADFITFEVETIQAGAPKRFCFKFHYQVYTAIYWQDSDLVNIDDNAWRSLRGGNLDNFVAFNNFLATIC